MAHIGLVVNPAAGRDIRRLTGGASVVDNYAKRRVAECVLEGMTLVDTPLHVSMMPDKTGIADDVVGGAPNSISIESVDMTVEGSATDTRRAAEHFREHVDAVVVLGGDGTSRDVAIELADVPLISVSTGTNNVVPTPVDGTVAGAAAAVVAANLIDVEAVTNRHGRINAVANDVNGEKQLTGLATVEIIDRPFIGTRAVVDPTELLGGVVSRAHPSDIGLGSVAGCIEPLSPDAPGGISLQLGNPETAPQTVRAIVAPGMTTTVGVEDHDFLSWNEPASFEVADGVVGADGERELELTDATVEMTPMADGPFLVDIRSALSAATDAGVLIRDETSVTDR